jgi:5-methylcytosine-specific restriction protein B
VVFAARDSNLDLFALYLRTDIVFSLWRYMSLDPLLEIVHGPTQEVWAERNKAAFEALFGSPDGRYPKPAAKGVTLRAPEMSSDSGVPFAAYIHPSNPPSGPYSGLSFVIFPVAGNPCLIGMGVGTQGLTPDEAILGRPGHARKAQAICSWLNREYGGGNFVAWAKQDATRTDVSVPDDVKEEWPAYKSVFDRYGKEMYALYSPTANRAGTEAAVTAFLDLLFDERGYRPIASSQANYDSIRSNWFEYLMPGVERPQVAGLLADRRYVIIQGPPGTGKTMMATELLQEEYGGRGRSIQFHPSTTYENFVGGLAPATSGGELGFRFTPVPGFLMEAAAQALSDPSRNYLLHIDEINRADLGKILGEAIFLLEPTANSERKIDLPYDFGTPFHRTFFLPKNLHILGTMNSADRSIAIVDVAVRRRFAFVSLWPRMSVVERYGCPTMQKAFRDLVSIFVEHATADVFTLVPGHSYFLESDEARAKQSLLVHLAPLLQEYLTQGYVGGFAEPIRGYLQRLRSK